MTKQWSLILLCLALFGCQGPVALKAIVSEAESGAMLFSIPLQPSADGSYQGVLRRPVEYDAIAGVHQGEKVIERVHSTSFPEHFQLSFSPGVASPGDPTSGHFSFDFQYVEQLLRVHTLPSGREIFRPVVKAFKASVPVTFDDVGVSTIHAAPDHTIVLKWER